MGRLRSDGPGGVSCDAPCVERPWIGPEYWSNPLQDWRIREGRIECLTRRANRNVALLVREVAEGDGDVHLRVRLGVIASDAPLPDSGRVGFRIGARGAFHDYRDTALRGSGLDVGVTALGNLFIGTPSEAAGDVSSAALFPDGVSLRRACFWICGRHNGRTGGTTSDCGWGVWVGRFLKLSRRRWMPIC